MSDNEGLKYIYVDANFPFKKRISKVLLDNIIKQKLDKILKCAPYRLSKNIISCFFLSYC